MKIQSIDWKKSIILGAIAGVIWGWVAMAVNAVSGAFPFENSVTQNIVNFAAGGAIFGIMVSGFLSLLQRWMPFRNVIANAVLLSAILWLLLRIGGAMLSSIEPERFHLVTVQTVQGFALAIILGGILGFLWKIKNKEA